MSGSGAVGDTRSVALPGISGPAAAGTAGCPRISASVDVARANGLPIITPPQTELKFCSGKPVTVEAGPHMKYHQEEYWRSPEWLQSWNRQTYWTASSAT
ncbi:hypothetical protein [Micromonospora sp. NPDC049679]|uniref:hypothetical protein n=1 Tax=Micromonospora sp. NPDC049679 TaxID=3155920 RepID=UPI0033E39467